jgi:hypothetical protein
VERGGARVKRFFVSEPRYFRGELKNLTEYRGSVTPGDLTGESFWYFLREKVLRGIRGETPKRKRKTFSLQPCAFSLL